MLRRLPALLWCALLPACPEGAGTPIEAYQAFVRAATKGDSKATYDALSGATRNLLDQKSRQIALASDGGIRDDPAALFLAQLRRPPPVTDIALGSQTDNRVVLRVTSGGAPADVRLVREGGAWKVDLTDSIH